MAPARVVGLMLIRRMWVWFHSAAYLKYIMNLYKVWYQLPIDESEDTFYYPPAWSMAYIYASSLVNAKAQVKILIANDQERLDEIGFVLRNIEVEKLRCLRQLLKSFRKDNNE